MRSQALLGSALLAGAVNASPYFPRLNSSTNHMVFSHPYPTVVIPSSSLSLQSSSTSTSSPASISSSSSASASSSSSLSWTSSSQYSASSTLLNSTSAESATSSPLSTNNTSIPTATNGSVPVCTGCVLEAINPITTYFVESEQATKWTSVVVTSTKLFETITYMINNITIDTIITETHTYYGNTTIVGTGPTVSGAPYASITHTTPSFTFEPVAGQTITLAAGPTYVAYLNLFGGLDEIPDSASTNEYSTLPFTTAPPPEATCDNLVDYLNVLPTDAEDYHYLIQTYSSGGPTYESGALLPIPASMIDYLRHDSAIVDVYGSTDIATCSLRPTATYTTLPAYSSLYMTPEPTTTQFGTPVNSFWTQKPTPPGNSPLHPPPPPFKSSVLPPPAYTPPPSSAPAYESQPYRTTATETYVSTTYQSTSTHVTRAGCLRCSYPNENPTVLPPTDQSQEHGPTVENVPSRPSVEIPSVQPPYVEPTGTSKGPQQRPQNPGNTITFGDNTVIVKPARPTQPDGGDNNNIIVGSKTLTPGQVITTDGHVISVPTGGHGSSLVVDGSTVPVDNNPNPTGPPVLSAGDKTITANSEGQFVIGSKTLKPGGPAVTNDGTTYSLGPSGSIAVVNGVTQSVGHGPAPTGPPVLTIKDHEISATVIGGTTAFVIAPGETLVPGSKLVVDGTTFSMPKNGHGSTVIMNGKTTTLHGGIPVITFDSQSVTATVKDGTTEFILGPGQTLTPGGILTVDGTTFSMPKDGSGSTIVVNGKSSTLSGTGLPIMTLSSDSVTASVIDATTAFVLGPGQTLTPGGVLTIDGTTFSMPASASGSLVVINGVTSTLRFPQTTVAPALTIGGKTYSATVRDGTTEYVLGKGTTLKPGEAVTISGTTISLDEHGTALIINGKTSTIPRLPATNSASTTASGSKSQSTSDSSNQSTTSVRAPGNFIASGIGITSKEGGAGRISGLDKWAEGIVIGLAGWLMMLL